MAVFRAPMVQYSDNFLTEGSVEASLAGALVVDANTTEIAAIATSIAWPSLQIDLHICFQDLEAVLLIDTDIAVRPSEARYTEALAMPADTIESTSL